MGYAGQVSLGQGGFYAAGAYAAALGKDRLIGLRLFIARNKLDLSAQETTGRVDLLDRQLDVLFVFAP